jgi:hypothetical protein
MSSKKIKKFIADYPMIMAYCAGKIFLDIVSRH